MWAAACAWRVLSVFEDRVPGDDRPRAALEGAEAFARGEIRVGAARALAIAAHDAAREAEDRAARTAARAAGHAVATAHIAGHARHAAAYAADAWALTRPENPNARRDEREWQQSQLPPSLREVVLPAAEPTVPAARVSPESA